VASAAGDLLCERGQGSDGRNSRLAGAILRCRLVYKVAKPIQYCIGPERGNRPRRPQGDSPRNLFDPEVIDHVPFRDCGAQASVVASAPRTLTAQLALELDPGEPQDRVVCGPPMNRFGDRESSLIGGNGWPEADQRGAIAECAGH